MRVVPLLVNAALLFTVDAASTVMLPALVIELVLRVEPPLTRMVPLAPPATLLVSAPVTVAVDTEFSERVPPLLFIVPLTAREPPLLMATVPPPLAKLPFSVQVDPTPVTVMNPALVSMPPLVVKSEPL